MRVLPFAVIAGLMAGGTVWYLYPQAPVPSQISSPKNISFLVAFGVGDKAGAVWNGTIDATGATIVSLAGWRFAGMDAVDGTTGWRLSTRLSPVVTGTGPLEENGIIVTAGDSGGNPTFTVKVPQGSFSFTAKDVQFGPPQKFLNGRAVVTQVPAPLAVAETSEDEDFPAIAQAGDDIYVAYVRFVHGERSQATGTATKTPIADFKFLSRPAGGDQVLLMHYSKSQRQWTGPVTISSSGESILRTAVAVDGQQRVWVFYAALRNGNFDIYARNWAGGALSDELALTSDPGTDIGPVAATDASGRVWVAWQGMRGGNLEILAAAQQGDTFSAEQILSTSPASDWDPAIAASASGDVAISWDTYDKGDYDVSVRRARFSDQMSFDDPIPIAASLNFEARSSLAYDGQNQLWIAYETSGPKWGKDFGAYDTTGIALYQNHSIQVRVLIGTDVYATTDDVGRVLPGAPQSQLFLASPNTPPPVQPDPTLAQKRGNNSNAPAPAAPRNSFPRLAVDSEGTVYLAFRHPAGQGLSTSSATGQSVGSSWIGEMVWFDGAKWQGPGYFARSDGLLDNRPALTALAPGQLLIAQAMDHRLSPPPGGTPQQDGVNSDIYALELPVARTQQAAQLQRIGAVTPDTPDPAAAAEAAASTLMNSYQARVGGQTLLLARGDFHRHTELSFDGGSDGPLVDAYRYSIDAAQLRWSGCCDHDDGSSREYSWWMEQKYNDAYFLPQRFVPMYYYERSVAYPEGHRNIMFATRGIRPLPRLPNDGANSPFAPAADTTMLYQYLHFYNGLTASHTSATDQGTDWRNNDPQVEPMVEIYQGDRQSYEMPGAPRSNTAADSISGYDPKGYVSNALAMGYKLAFEASSDHISTHISFTNLWLSAFTRAGIIEAVQKRHVYGSTDYILADFRSGAHFMGDIFTTASAPSFSVKLWGTNAFANVTVIKDGTSVYSTKGDKVIAFTWQDNAPQKGKTSYYYVRGTQTDGQIVWVSPMWVTMQ
jgi:Periplasmic component of the Tol biopolymer transport system